MFVLNIILACKKAPEKTLGSLDFTVFIKDYSMIVATRPEPTVLPPSRIKVEEPYLANGVFSVFSVITFSEIVNFLCVFRIFVANL